MLTPRLNLLFGPLRCGRLSVMSVSQIFYRAQLQPQVRIAQSRKYQTVIRRSFSVSSSCSKQSEAVIANASRNPKTGATPSLSENENPIDVVPTDSSEVISGWSGNALSSEEVIPTILQDGTKEFISTYFGWGADLVQSLLENIHAMTGFPWWLTIVAGSLIIRSTFIPLIFMVSRTDFMLKQMQKLKDKANSPYARGVVGLREMNKKLDGLIRKKKIYSTTLKSAYVFVSPFVTISSIWGLQNMAGATVKGFSSGGLFWFTDLSIPDPYYILPVIYFAILYIHDSLWENNNQVLKDNNQILKDNNQVLSIVKHMTNAFNVAVLLFIAYFFSSGTVICMITSDIATRATREISDHIWNIQSEEIKKKSDSTLEKQKIGSLNKPIFDESPKCRKMGNKRFKKQDRN